MSPDDYRHAIRLLNSVLATVENRQSAHPASVRRQLRTLALELDLLRARLRQPAARLQRN